MDTSDQATVGAGESDVPPRRMRTNEEKRRIVEEALVPGASVAAVARRHGVNANLLFGWRRLHKQGLLERSREPTAWLLPVQVTSPTVVTERRSTGVTGSSSRLRGRSLSASRSSGHIVIFRRNGATGFSAYRSQAVFGIKEPLPG